MAKINIMYDYLYEHFKGIPECIEYTSALAEALGYKIIAKPLGQYLELNFYNNFIPKAKEIK